MTAAFRPAHDPSVPDRTVSGVSPDARTIGPALAARMVFVLLPGFDALTLSSAVASLRTANRLSNREVFRWDFCATDRETVTSSDGWSVETRALDDAVWQADIVIVCGGARPEAAASVALPDLIRKLWRRGKVVAGLYGGVFTLASSGILAGHNFAVHGEQCAVFSDSWPNLTPHLHLYHVNGRIMTCAGGVAAADLMLQLVRGHLGPELCHAAMQACMIPGFRPEGMPQSASAAIRLNSRNPGLLRAVRWIEDNFLQEDCLGELSGASGVSPRQLQRLFRNHLGHSPRGYVTELRMKQALSLLSHTDLSAAEVAIACGYEQTGNFTKAFRNRFGVAPTRFGRMAKRAEQGKHDQTGDHAAGPRGV